MLSVIRICDFTELIRVSKFRSNHRWCQIIRRVNTVKHIEDTLACWLCSMPVLAYFHLSCIFYYRAIKKICPMLYVTHIPQFFSLQICLKQSQKPYKIENTVAQKHVKQCTYFNGIFAFYNGHSKLTKPIHLSEHNFVVNNFCTFLGRRNNAKAVPMLCVWRG